MTISNTKELLKLIQNEVDLGFTLLETFRMSMSMGHLDHAAQALKNASAACETATGFLPRLPEEQADQFRGKLQELGSAIRASAVDFRAPE